MESTATTQLERPGPSEHNPESGEPNDQSVGFPFHHYVPTHIEPCCLDAKGNSQVFHLLSCGHPVAVDAGDNRCGLNCLHVTTWITAKLSQTPEEKVDLKPGCVSLFDALTSTRPHAHRTILPPASPTQAHDNIYCELCEGLPVSSYNLVKPNNGLRRALALTRPVIEHFTGYDNDILPHLLAPLFYNPDHLSFDWKLTHQLRCGHEVWCEPCRPCASNCNDAPQCRGRIFPRNIKQGDAILCRECTYRAELVYARYATAGGGGAQKEVSRDGLTLDTDGPYHDGSRNGCVTSGETSFETMLD